MNKLSKVVAAPLKGAKFQDPQRTAKGDERASVAFSNPTTLWFNTGTLCNIECLRCYIDSSPTNDALVYISKDEVVDYLDQIAERQWPVTEIGFTGGEPFMNPHMIDSARECLERGFDVLILTNAMRPMMRPKVREGLLALNAAFEGKMTLRISLDHHLARHHDEERGAGAFEASLEGMRWLRDNGFKMTVAGRTIWGEKEDDARAGFAALFKREQFQIDAANPASLVLFPEMDDTADVPEITTDCWSILNKSPSQVMCSSSRMVVKRKGAQHPSVVACTLLPYEPEFDLGRALEDAEKSVFLNHPHCSKFCVLGGASCTA